MKEKKINYDKKDRSIFEWSFAFADEDNYFEAPSFINKQKYDIMLSVKFEL